MVSEQQKYMVIRKANLTIPERIGPVGKVEADALASEQYGSTENYVQRYIFTPQSEKEVQQFIQNAAWCMAFEGEIHYGGPAFPGYWDIRPLFSDEAWLKLDADCRVFLWRLHTEGVRLPDHLMGAAGVDFHFSRQGHGTGFWDKPELYGELKDKLHAATEEPYCEVYFDIEDTDDGKQITAIYGGFQPEDEQTYPSAR